MTTVRWIKQQDYASGIGLCRLNNGNWAAVLKPFPGREARIIFQESPSEAIAEAEYLRQVRYSINIDYATPAEN